MKTMPLKEIEKQINTHEESLSKLKAIRAAMLPNKTVACRGFYVSDKGDKPKYRPGCMKRSRIGNLIYVQKHYYHEPHGCTGGDYWSPSEGGFVCPSCGEYNRLVNREDVVALKRSFKKVMDVHRQSVSINVEKNRYIPTITE